MIQIGVDGVCGDCKLRIEKAALGTKGVKVAGWDLATHQLSVIINPRKFDLEKLHQNIAAVGHDTEKLWATDEAYNQLDDCCRYRSEEVREAHQDPQEESRPGAGPTQLSLFVDGVCGMCEDRIGKAARQTPGVVSAAWSAATRQLSVEVEPGRFSEDELHRNVAAAGHDTEKLRAPDEAYGKLHDCCKYRSEEVMEAHQPAQEAPTGPVSGIVYREDEQGLREPLTGANVFWLGTGRGATTGVDGRFELERTEGTQELVVSYVGSNPDTIDVAGISEVEVLLSDEILLSEVRVTYRRKSTEVSLVDPIKVQSINEQELMKAACCNLSESFETNPSVDVSFTDAVTGARQIEMLGLAGPYVQITRESMPDIRGLSAIYGLTYIPGPWIEGIQLIKGPGSVVNGYESIAGQINVELRKPENSDRLYLNLFANEGGRLEANANLAHSLSERWHTGLLLHGKSLQAKMDRNGDGFLDNTLDRQVIAVNRWKFTGNNGYEGQFGLRGTYIDNQGGQVGFDPDADRTTSQFWGAGLQTRRLEGWMKVGRVFPGKPYSSIGLQLSGLYHDQESFFGRRAYDADQKMGYANLIYQSIIGNSFHQFRTGLSFQWDQYGEGLDSLRFDRNELVPGAFFEYTYDPGERFTAVAGLRADYHNLFGPFFTPRLHLRYALTDNTVLRASAGRGQRTASIIAEHIGALASARDFVIHSEDPDKPYGLDAEVAWNLGLNLTQSFTAAGRQALFSLDLYHTLFRNQIVVDYDQNPQALHFYNLDGRSFTNSLQAQFDYELLPRLDVRLAYRFNDVRTTYGQRLLEKPLVARHRAFVNTAYGTGNGWKFDLTVNWQGAKRIPFTGTNPAEYRLPDRSPDFALLNAQVSKKWSEKFELYLGAENLLDFRQEDPILSSGDPFGPYFDSSLVWGPVFGRMVYTGLRYRL